jgi:hypothetical protein
MNMVAWAVVPFYYPKDKTDLATHVGYLKAAVSGLREAGIQRVIVVDDGSEIALDKQQIDCDDLLVSAINLGKAEAVRRGLRHIFDRASGLPDCIVQCDYDADQDSRDSHLLIEALSNGNVSGLSLVIGDRYMKAQSDIPDYRKAMLRLQQLLCKRLGFEIQDTVSGLRAYTKEFARTLLQMSKAEGFGIDIEEIIIAYLNDMKVGALELTFARKRGVFTPQPKLMDVMNGILGHEATLRAKGQQELVDLIEELQQHLKRREDQFVLRLEPFERHARIIFTKMDGNYTAEFRIATFRDNEEAALLNW